MLCTPPGAAQHTGSTGSNRRAIHSATWVHAEHTSIDACGGSFRSEHAVGRCRGSAPGGDSAGWHGGWLPGQAGMHLRQTAARPSHGPCITDITRWPAGVTNTHITTPEAFVLWPTRLAMIEPQLHAGSGVLHAPPAGAAGRPACGHRPHCERCRGIRRLAALDKAAHTSDTPSRSKYVAVGLRLQP